MVVVENYSRNLALVDTFCRYAPERCTLLLSEKAEIHELRAPALLDKIGNRHLVEYEVDMLIDAELKRMSNLLDLRGLWGERAGLSELQRLAYLREDCGRQLHAVLIDVIKSPHIRARLSEIIEHFDSVDGGRRMLMALCLAADDWRTTKNRCGVRFTRSKIRRISQANARSCCASNSRRRIRRRFV